MKSVKEKFDKKFPEAKIFREIELKRTTRELFNKSAVGKVMPAIYLGIALMSIFVYWKFFGVNIFLSILFGIITWFVITYIFDKILIKLSGIDEIVRKINDAEMEKAGKELEGTLGEGRSIDDLLK